MDTNEKAAIEAKVIQVVQSLSANADGWVDFANIGAPLTAAGVQYKQLGFPKLRLFLNEFQDALEFEDKQCVGKPPVYYVRTKVVKILGTDKAAPHRDEPKALLAKDYSNSITSQPQKIPTKSSWLFSWASIPPIQIQNLSELALEEKWYYGGIAPSGDAKFAILKSYLQYTFKRLCTENKIQFKEDLEKSEEYASFNTGLVDHKYEYIYALFKKNTMFPTPYWYLIAFVVAGEDAGKTLVNLFSPLPVRAEYFGNKIQNMLYDTSTGELSCDYAHILTERTSRFPVEFFNDNCPKGYTDIDGVSIEDVFYKGDNDSAKKDYFMQLGTKIRNDYKILNRLKNRLNDAVGMALKRVEWNYKTAIPMYFPTKETMSLLLPLALVDEEQVDLALVVERKQSGAYQGQTILSLDWAYSNSRLVTRPDSDWLKTDNIVTSNPDEAIE